MSEVALTLNSGLTATSISSPGGVADGAARYDVGRVSHAGSTMFDTGELRVAVERHLGGGTPPRPVASYWKGEIPWASVKDFKDGQIEISSTQESISPAGLSASASHLVPAGIPLVCTRMAVGRAALPTVPMAINQDVKALFPAPGVDPKHLLRLLHYVQPKAEAASVGSTVKGIRIEDYLGLVVPQAPVNEQPVMAHVLDTLDTTIRQTEAIIAKLKQVKQGLLHDLLTRGIDANGELRPPQREAPHLYKQSPLGWIPATWADKSLDDITAAPICYGIVQVFEFVPAGVPVLAIRDLLGDFSTDIHRTALSIDAAYSRSRVQPGDVLISVKGTIGRIAVVPSHYVGNISRDIARIRPNIAARPGYLCQLLRSSIGQGVLALAQVGSTRAELSIAPLRRLRLPIPSLEEQKLIERALEIHDSLVRQESSDLSKLREVKSGLMDDLLTGRVRVTPLLALDTPPTGP